MPVQRKRKHAPVEDERASKHSRTAHTQRSINAFGSIRKPHVRPTEKQKMEPEAETTSLADPVATDHDRTRKRKSDAVDADEDNIAVRAQAKGAMEDVKTRPTTPLSRNKRSKRGIPPTASVANTPTRSAVALFDQLRIDANPRAIPCVLAPQPPGALGEIADLQDLYRSFLSSLSLYYAHNGSGSPVDVQALLSMMTKKWGKRRVSLADLQCILAVVDGTASEVGRKTFLLHDYGRAGIRLSRGAEEDERGRARSRAAAPSYIDEDELNCRFEDALQKSWLAWSHDAGDAAATASKENRTPAAFVLQLPLCEIARHESVEKAAPLFARGQQRLADLKAHSHAAKRTDPIGTSASALPPSPPSPPQQQHPASPAPPAPAPQNRGAALLDRVLARQTLASRLPTGPSAAQLERRAALQRVEDVARVLSSLQLAGRPHELSERCSFSLPALVRQLQQSLRNPIGRVEVERVLDLLAAELAPGYVRLVRTGDVTAVVLLRSQSVALSDLRERVRRAGGA